MKRKQKSRKWMQRHVSDEFVQKAQKDGFRSRAVYKLEEIDQKDRLFRLGMRVVDLGAAPGGWSQYARQRVGDSGQVLALDILPMDPLDGVTFVQGDFTTDEVYAALLASLEGTQVDLVISDMAPNLSGTRAVDVPRSIYLAELALDFAVRTLRPGGNLLIKTFQGEGFTELRQQILVHFQGLTSRKPRASRSESRELYLLGRGFRGS